MPTRVGGANYKGLTPRFNPIHLDFVKFFSMAVWVNVGRFPGTNAVSAVLAAASPDNHHCFRIPPTGRVCYGSNCRDATWYV